MKKKLFLIFTWFFFYIIFSVKYVQAEAFTSKDEVLYQVYADGKVKVSQDISITNKLANVYATQYTLTLKELRVENVRAADEGGALKAEVNQNNEMTTIILHFNGEVVGAEKILKFNISYDVLNIAQKKGQIWEVNIPKLSEVSQADSYQLTLEVPNDFGDPSSIKPNPIEIVKQNQQTLYKFNKNQLLISGVNAIFGQMQIFDFNLNYHLENTGLSSENFSLALPMDTAFQQLFYQVINPPPLNVEVDDDGNWLAKYRLSAGQNLTINAQGKVKIFFTPRENAIFGRTPDLTKYLRPSKYWESDNPEIKKLAFELKTPRKIYDFVLKTLSYDYQRVTETPIRFGALKALENPQNAICMEFTDLFVALCRAAGIATREINGFAYTTNTKIKSLESVADILHSWPEYFDPDRFVWIPVDPTWGETTQGQDYFSKTDLFHFAFVIHGLNSEEPYPAGSYNVGEKTAKDVQVNFGIYDTQVSVPLKISFDLPKQILFGQQLNGKIFISNESSSAVYEIKVQISTGGLIVDKKEEIIAVLPPYSTKEISLRISGTQYFTFNQGKLTVNLDGQQESCQIKIGSVFWQIILPLIIFGILITGGLLLTKRKFSGKI